MAESIRLKILLGKGFNIAMHPFYSLLASAMLFMVLLPISYLYWQMTALGCVYIYLFLLAFRWESRLLNYYPFPPLTCLMGAILLRLGIGPIMMAVFGNSSGSGWEAWWSYMPQVQLVWLVFTLSIIIFSYILVFRPSKIAVALSSKPLKKLERFGSIQIFLNSSSFGVSSNLKILFYFLTCFSSLYILFSVYVDSWSRNTQVYLKLTNVFWRADTVFIAFNGLFIAWLILAPLIASTQGKLLRLAVAANLIIYFIVALPSGGREVALYPILYLIGGMFLTNIRPELYRKILFFGLVFCILAVPFLALLRSNQIFQDSPTLISKYQAVLVILQKPQEIFRGLGAAGARFFGCHDPYLFAPFNKDLYHPGFMGLGHLLFVYVPNFLMHERPIIFDGWIYALQLHHLPVALGTKSFECLYTPADLIRRFGWPGLLIGSPIIGFIIAFLIRSWYRCASLDKSIFQFLLFLYPASFFWKFPFGTVMEFGWHLLWQMPKYLCAFAVISFLISRYSPRFAR